MSTRRVDDLEPAAPAVPPARQTAEGRPAGTTPAGVVPAGATWRDSLVGSAVKIVLLGLVAGIALWVAFPLVQHHAWVGLGILVVTTVGLFCLYLTRRAVPLKYLVPGTLFLLAFQLFPVLYTVNTAFSNFGDGHRGSKADAIVAIQTASVIRVPGSDDLSLTVAARGGSPDGPLVFLIVDPKTGQTSVGDEKGLATIPADQVTVAFGRINAATGYTILNVGEASQRSDEITSFTVPTEGGAIRSVGLSHAYIGQATQRYGAACDCVTDSTTGHAWAADNANGSFVDNSGARLAQGWRVNVGLRNFTRVVTDPTISGPFLRTFVWNFAFAVGSVLVTFALGVACALALNSARLRGLRIYRILLVLPYAMPSFAMLLVWRDMFNTDFGLINNLFGLNVDWFGNPWTARLAVILVQLWLGYPYMFLVATGALQAIPSEMLEAAQVDGATAAQRLRRVTLPLLLVALSPLLIASFAFNFNNFNAIYLTTEGGPFAADNTTVGATDLLITYTYRLAFGASGAQYGFAAAISIFIFLIVAIISAAGFRRTRAQEEVF
jgi:arabinogalactan oligomer/maltooligosaccharide transport system permease protein